MYIKNLLLASCLLVPSFAHAGSAELLVEAVKKSNEISQNLPTKQKLENYKIITNSLNEIVDKYPASPEAIQIISGQKIGGFDPTKITHDYVYLLTDYYETVCEKSPSYNCLAFASLGDGIKQCSAANKFSDIETAQNTLLNAINIFNGQNNESYADLAINTYRNCSNNSSVSLTTWGKDYSNSKLIKPLLHKGKSDVTKAIIENMTSPYFKLEGVLSLKAASGNLADAAYVDRLETYIDEKFEEDSVNAFLASVKLRIFAYQNSTKKIDFMFAYNAVQKHRPYSSMIQKRYDGTLVNPEQCNDPSFTKYLYDLMIEAQTSLYNVPKERSELVTNQLATQLYHYSNHPKTGLNACAKEGKFDYSLMANVYGIILTKKGKKEATKFKKMTDDKELTVEEIYSYYIDIISPTKEDFYSALNSEGRRDENLFLNEEATFPIFKKHVDFGQVCEASALLFQNLKGSDKYNIAVDYMINSPNIDPNLKYNCGDEDLELLLN